MTVALCLAVTACGFRPLYGPTDDEQSAPEARLAQVRIKPLSGRVGQKLHNLLRDRVNPAGQPSKPDQTLSIKVISRTNELGIRKDESATRANLILQATFELRDAKSQRPLVRGVSKSVNSYNILDAFYATTVSEQDALDRGLRELADSIALRLAVYFSDPSAAPPAPRPEVDDEDEESGKVEAESGESE